MREVLSKCPKRSEGRDEVGRAAGLSVAGITIDAVSA